MGGDRWTVGDAGKVDGKAYGLAVSPREHLAAISVVSPDEEPQKSTSRRRDHGEYLDGVTTAARLRHR